MISILITIIIIILSIFYFGHYFYRSMIYPFLLPIVSSRMDFIPVIAANIFNIANGTMIGYNTVCIIPNTVQSLNGLYCLFYIIVGTISFVIMWCICHWHDMYLIHLKNSTYHKKERVILIKATKQNKPITTNTKLSPKNKIQQPQIPQKHYITPKGGLFSLCWTPNYFAEMLQWLSFSMISQWSYPTLLFFLLTISNLLPRWWHYRHFYENNLTLSK